MVQTAAATPAPIDRLRRIVASAEAGAPLPPDDAAWLAQGARAYLEDAPAVRLDAALGLHPGWGESGWWTTGPRAERDTLLAQIDRQLFGQLDIPTAARSIVALVRRRHEPAAAPFLDRLAATGRGVPGDKQLRNILRRARAKDAIPPAAIRPSAGKSDAVSSFPA
jgi:hypothetical protein